SVRSGQRQIPLLSPAEGFVHSENFPEDQHERLDFQHDMVIGPDELELGHSITQQSQAEQRRVRQVESATSIRSQKLPDAFIPLATGDSAPVLLFPWQLDVREHVLLRFIKIFPTKFGA